MFSYISTRDHDLMRKLNGWRPPRWVRAWMILASRLGDGWLWYAIGLILLFFGGPVRFVAVGAATVSAALSLGLFLRIKRIINRRRPCEIESCSWSTLLPPDQFSFPSGHSMTAFSVTVPLSLFYPSLEPGLLFCAFSIALSRVMLGLHFLSDVLVGSALGAILGYTMYRIVT
ncbi:MAG TPA: phosphatase PAP2 family protein [Bryobacteraceae bacterium]|jgi:undecaprenyl-diphosphatase|nr:phosphatase PAP2 family protein [Bryobacteraceae bacterium]